MFDQLKDLKDTYESIKSQVERGKEPTEDLLKLDNFVKALVANPEALQEKDKDYQRFFYDDITSGLFKRFSREKSRDEKYLEVLSSIFEQMMLIFLAELKAGRYNQCFLENIKNVFEYDNILHNYNYQIPEDELKKLRNQNQEWRKELNQGDLVDAIIDDNTRCSGWSQARIAQVIDDTLHLEFFLDTKSADRYLDRWSVEIAQFETKTKELFDYKAGLQTGSTVDVHDKTIWNKSTILDMKEQIITPDRQVQMCLIGYRVYTETGQKTDEQGTYDGWSNRFDEWISLYSPRIQPIFSKTQKGQSDDVDLDDEMDNMIQPEKGMTRVFAVPRLRKCTSSMYIHLINTFGFQKGYDTIMDIVQNAPISENSQFDLTIMSNLVQCIATPTLIYHKDFAAEYLPKFVEVCKKRLKDAPEKSLRDVRREKIESIIKSIDIMNKRLLSKDQREKEIEILKLEVALICLKSSFLERRIQGVRDLNQVIKNNRMFNNKNFTAAFLIEWLHENQVFNILFDPKKTHLQIVQRTSDVLKLLLMEDMFSQEIMEMFWGLVKSDYKFEVYKIINDVSFYLKQNHIDYFFSQIKQIPADKIAMEEFQCLSELGKFGKNDDFKIQVGNYFWDIICNSDQYKEDLVNNCITKFCEMVKNWELQKKASFFHQLSQNLAQNKSSVPSLKLFKGLIKDHKDKTQYSSSPQKTSANNQDEIQEGEAKEQTLSSVLDQVIKQDDLVGSVLKNLKHYYDLANKSTQQVDNDQRKKLFLVNPKYSHHEEVDERLQFIKYLATVSDFSISKVELGVIYDLLAKQSKVPSDQEEFLIWCKTSCEQSTPSVQILDLDEVGLFFTEKMKSKELDIKNLPLVGFDFLSQYFLSLNDKEGSLIKAQKAKPAQAKSIGVTYQYGLFGGYYGPQVKDTNNTKAGGAAKGDEDQGTLFKLTKLPTELSQLDIIWNLALNCEDSPKTKQQYIKRNPYCIFLYRDQRVVPKAIDFLIKVYSQDSLDQDLKDQRMKVQDSLIEKCMSILKDSKDEFTIKRVIEIIKNIIYNAERKGTVDVQQHSALLKGELLEKINIKNKASTKRGNMILSVYSNATAWEFKKEISKQLDLAPQYLKIEKADGSTIKDIYNGKTLGELGFKNGEQLIAYKANVEDDIPDAPLIGADGKLTERALDIFNEWFDMYSDRSGSMTKETCALFIKGSTGEHPSITDERIVSMFKQYDINNDGKIERSEFIIFYETASKNKPLTVRENLKAHNIRNDLKKLSEIKEETSFTSEEMPRYKISTNQEQFDILISILDRQDQASAAAWDLIQMLATNQVLYKRVLQLKTAADASGKINWGLFFDNNSVYKLLYTLQIIEAVMEEGEDSNNNRIIVVEDIQTNLQKNVPQPPPQINNTTKQQNEAETTANESEQQDKPEEQPIKEAQKVAQVAPIEVTSKSSSVIQDTEEDKKLKSEWTLMFLENNGFDYILKVLMEKNISNNNSSDNKQQSFDQIFELKHVAFLLKLLRIFIMAAFSTSTKESSVYEVASLVRRSSSIHSEDQLLQESQNDVAEGQRFKELQNLLQGPLGEQLIDSIDYKNLQVKILQLIAQVLEKKTMIFEDKLIIENALSLWVSFVLHKNELINDFYQFKGEDRSSIKNADDLILNGLLFCPQDKVREEFKQSLSSLSNKLMNGSSVKQTPLIFLLKLLSQNFKLISDYPCKQYFELFCELIDHYFLARAISADSNLQKEAFNPEQLLVLIIDKIKEYNKLAQQSQNDQTSGAALSAGGEEGENDEVSEQENIYIGLIQLAGKIIDNFDISFSEKIVEEKSLIDEIFVNFLFSSVFQHDSQNSLENLKIKPQKGMRKSGKKQMFGKKSKDTAYKLLNSLIRKSPLLMNSFLEKCLVPLMKLIKRQEGWGYSPPGTQERSQRYVGLRNLGCICYLNSLLQQFFMIPAFRYNLLSIDDKLPDDLVEYKGNMIDDNVLHQLQKLMAHLELSERQDFNPYEFCFAFKDLDGAPTNTSEQKDAQEFLSLSFDRIDNLLRSTPQKYLLQSVFGGQTCSQLLCQECGKVKNRIEDFSNLSVTVKDIKSLHDSLKKLIEGEVISDYQCDGCKKKVDISKRTLISQTPNVLIVHLQRIIFNFDSFRNDKINSFFEFPYHLDLKPYSFQEVMSKEKRYMKKKNNTENEDGDEEPKEEQAEDDDSQWPEEEDCFEYKLVGVNVHSGTANAGHYWSYINIKRGQDEPAEDDPQWAQTETDPWMEFNDSTVKDFNFEKMKEECYGGDGKGGDDGGWSFGGSYGKSAYMLFYERRIKRPLKILVNEDEGEAAIKNGDKKIIFDSSKTEYYKMVDYREGVEDIAPNQIYKQVFEDNTKFGFEKDIYSTEFFEFVKNTLNAVIQLNNKTSDKQIEDRQSQNSKLMSQINTNALTIGKKASMEILAKCFYNQGIDQMVQCLIEILKKDDELCKTFIEQGLQEDNGNYFMELLLECTDPIARHQISLLFKYVLNRLKIIEKDYLNETQPAETINEQGESYTWQQPKALSARFIQRALWDLNNRVAKNWNRFDQFLDILYIFGVGPETDPKNPKADTTPTSVEEQNLGLEFYFKQNFVERACDFILGKKSPLIQPGEKRIEMGGSFSNPNFSGVIKLITKMITNEELINKYPLSEQSKKMLLHQDLLNVILGASSGSKQFGQCLANMCKENEKLSKKVAKVYIKSINNSKFDTVKNYLQALKPFLKMNDSLKQYRLEWVLGFSQVLTRRGYREEKFKYGLELVDKINDEANVYVSPIISGALQNALLTQLVQCKGKQDSFAVNCLKEMVSLMAKDEDIARFVYRSAPATYQTARYSDWIRPYLENQKAEIERSTGYSYFKAKYDTVVKALTLLEIYEQKCEQFKIQDQAQVNRIIKGEDGFFSEAQQDWQAFKSDEIIPHFPPQLIIGKQSPEEKELLVFDEDPNVKVTLTEITNEYSYSNPTGFFNLSLPHLEFRTNHYTTLSYAQYKKMQEDNLKSAQKQQNKKEGNSSDEDEEDDLTNDTVKNDGSVEESEQTLSPSPSLKRWFEEKREGQVLMKVTVANKCGDTLTAQIYIKTAPEEDGSTEQPNIVLPVSFLNEQLYGEDVKVVAHLQKIDPVKPWPKLQVKVETQIKVVGNNYSNNEKQSSYNSGGIQSGSSSKLSPNFDEVQ